MTQSEFSFKKAFEIQKEHLAHWKLLLNDKAYSLLEKEVNLRNSEGYKIPFGVFRGNDMDNFIRNITKDDLDETGMVKLNIIYTLEMQDGENRYTLHSPQTIQAKSIKDTETINREGEELAKTYYDKTSTEPNNGDWYEVDGGCRAIRYKSFEVIEDKPTFKLIERILYK
jgi:hypothetical protein